MVKLVLVMMRRLLTITQNVKHQLWVDNVGGNLNHYNRSQFERDVLFLLRDFLMICDVFSAPSIIGCLDF